MQTRKDDTAFPIFDSDGAFNEYGCHGLTKREYFAAKALQGLIASGYILSDTPRKAVETADYLIKVLNEQP